MVESSDRSDAVLPLSRVRILAIEQMIAAPWATQLLARLGADVIKVEHPERGESGRASVPAITGPDGRSVGATFLRNNLDKRSVGIDLERGADLVLDLAEHCDVLVENSKPGAMDKVGLGYDAVAARNPRIIYASLTGFGTTTASPYRDWPAYASIAEAMSGIYEWARQPGRPPVINPVGGLGDIGTGMFAALGILAALRHRDITGKGQHVDVAMFDAMVAIADVVPSMWSLGERTRIPGAILTTFEAADGLVVVQVSREHQFARFATVVGHPEWVDDARFATRSGWVEHLDSVIRPAVERWSKTLSKRAVCSAFAEAGIPAGPCNDAEEVLADEHLAARDMLIRFEEGDASYVVPGNPIKLSAVDAPDDVRPPWLGEHTDSILEDLLGIDAGRVAELRALGIVG